jgi:proteasome accessory factor A
VDDAVKSVSEDVPARRIIGIETEYGCLSGNREWEGDAETWPMRVKNYLFRRAAVGAIDLHYRDYEEPPGNGGFLRNGGRIYLDMGHLEYSSPECLGAIDAAIYDAAGERLLQLGLEGLGVAAEVSFIKNNIDHHTGATFGCHENYLMRRDTQFTPQSLGALLSFLATRQIYSGAGRVGQAAPLSFDFEIPDFGKPIHYQISQRADHIVNDIYQWVQFNRAIINARDEPLADHRRYRRLHLLIGDSNVSPFATALKTGTTSLVLSLLEHGIVPRGVSLADAVMATREISRDPSLRWLIKTESGRTRNAIEIQRDFLDLAQSEYGGSNEETDWILRSWGFALESLEQNTKHLVGAVDWISKRWMLEQFMESETLDWDDPWLMSLDLEYHNINCELGLFRSLTPAKAVGEFNDMVWSRAGAMWEAPQNTRAAGRSIAIRHFMDRPSPYVVNWDSISSDRHTHFSMNDPFKDYTNEIREFLGA